MFGMYLVLNDDFAVKFVHHLEFGYFSWVGGAGVGLQERTFHAIAMHREPCTLNSYLEP